MISKIKYLRDIVLELLESFGLFLCLILSMPIKLLKRLDRLKEGFAFARALAPKGLFAPLMRAFMERHMGNNLQSANMFDQVAQVLEGQECEYELHEVRTLTSIYSLLFEQFVLSGNLEQATLVILRAHAQLGIERLPTTPNFDVKVAQVVKAGIAAGKLLEDGGLATLMVRQGDEPILSQPEKPKSKLRRNKNKSSGATIIPFPQPQP